MQEDDAENAELDSNPVGDIRRTNLRQLLLRASRRVNKDVVKGLHDQGHTFLTAAHTTLLSNIDMEGGTTSEIAERAGITKQAMGRLAVQLVDSGYLVAVDVPGDRRAKHLTFTEKGRTLMEDSFEVMRCLERSYADETGRDDFAQLMRALKTIACSSA